MKAWTDSGYLLKHVDEHISTWDPMSPCPHPLCTARIDDVQDLRYHRDQHRLWTARWSESGIKRPNPESGNDDSDPLVGTELSLPAKAAGTDRSRHWNRTARRKLRSKWFNDGGFKHILHGNQPCLAGNLATKTTRLSGRQPGNGHGSPEAEVFDLMGGTSTGGHV
jgi:hypothetical protein